MDIESPSSTLILKMDQSVIRLETTPPSANTVSSDKSPAFSKATLFMPILQSPPILEGFSLLHLHHHPFLFNRSGNDSNTPNLASKRQDLRLIPRRYDLSLLWSANNG